MGILFLVCSSYVMLCSVSVVNVHHFLVLLSLHRIFPSGPCTIRPNPLPNTKVSQLSSCCWNSCSRPHSIVAPCCTTESIRNDDPIWFRWAGTMFWKHVKNINKNLGKTSHDFRYVSLGRFTSLEWFAQWILRFLLRWQRFRSLRVANLVPMSCTVDYLCLWCEPPWQAIWRISWIRNHPLTPKAHIDIVVILLLRIVRNWVE